jgi:small subunit ribosomal protein S20
MANTKSSKKDLRRSAKKRVINQGVKSALKTYIKKVKQSAKKGEAELTSQSLVAAISALDKAVQRGIIHKNQAARRKSRAAKAANSLGQVAAAPTSEVEDAPETAMAETASAPKAKAAAKSSGAKSGGAKSGGAKAAPKAKTAAKKTAKK